MIIQKRDLEILKWGLEMRFMDIEMVHRSFFDGDNPSMSTARNRIRVLKNEGYLKKVLGFDGSTKSYYLVTRKSFNFLKINYPDELLVSPLKKFSAHSFEHDRRVSLCRIELEKSGRAKNWQSERRLKAEFAKRSIKIARDHMPDAIFESKIGMKCAFELEISPKTHKRYQEKIDKFTEIIDQKDSLFGLCLFVVETDFSFRKLNELTKPYGNRFRIQKYGEIIKDGD